MKRNSEDSGQKAYQEHSHSAKKKNTPQDQSQASSEIQNVMSKFKNRHMIKEQHSLAMTTKGSDNKQLASYQQSHSKQESNTLRVDKSIDQFLNNFQSGYDSLENERNHQTLDLNNSIHRLQQQLQIQEKERNQNLHDTYAALKSKENQDEEFADNSEDLSFQNKRQDHFKEKDVLLPSLQRNHDNTQGNTFPLNENESDLSQDGILKFTTSLPGAVQPDMFQPVGFQLDQFQQSLLVNTKQDTQYTDELRKMKDQSQKINFTNFIKQKPIAPGGTTRLQGQISSKMQNFSQTKEYSLTQAVSPNVISPRQVQNNGSMITSDFKINQNSGSIHGSQASMQINREMEKLNKTSEKQNIDRQRNFITNVIASSRSGMPNLLKHEFFDGAKQEELERILHKKLYDKAKTTKRHRKFHSQYNFSLAASSHKNQNLSGIGSQTLIGGSSGVSLEIGSTLASIANNLNYMPQVKLPLDKIVLKNMEIKHEKEKFNVLWVDEQDTKRTQRQQASDSKFKDRSNSKAKAFQKKYVDISQHENSAQLSNKMINQLIESGNDKGFIENVDDIIENQHFLRGRKEIADASQKNEVANHKLVSYLKQNLLKNSKQRFPPQHGHHQSEKIEHQTLLTGLNSHNHSLERKGNSSLLAYQEDLEMKMSKVDKHIDHHLSTIGESLASAEISLKIREQKMQDIIDSHGKHSLSPSKLKMAASRKRGSDSNLEQDPASQTAYNLKSPNKQAKAKLAFMQRVPVKSSNHLDLAQIKSSNKIDNLLFQADKERRQRGPGLGGGSGSIDLQTPTGSSFTNTQSHFYNFNNNYNLNPYYNQSNTQSKDEFSIRPIKGPLDQVSGVDNGTDYYNKMFQQTQNTSSTKYNWVNGNNLSFVNHQEEDENAFSRNLLELRDMQHNSGVEDAELNQIISDLLEVNIRNEKETGLESKQSFNLSNFEEYTSKERFSIDIQQIKRMKLSLGLRERYKERTTFISFAKTLFLLRQKIKRRQLNLTGYHLSPGHSKALQIAFTYFENLLGRLHLENNNLKDEEFAEILEGLSHLQDLKGLVYKTNEFGLKSVQFVKPLLLKMVPNNLEELRIINCKLHPSVIETLLKQCNERCYLKRLALVRAGLNDGTMRLLVDYLRGSRLIELDISWNGLKPQALSDLIEFIGDNRQLSYLNISWNNILEKSGAAYHQQDSSVKSLQTSLMNKTQSEASKILMSTMTQQLKAKATNASKASSEQSQKIISSFSSFIKYNKNLLHFDMSFTGMSESILWSLGTALRRSKSMVSIHMSGNPGVTDSLKDYLHRRVRCKPNQKLRQIAHFDMLVKKSLDKNSHKQKFIEEGVQLKNVLHHKKQLSTSIEQDATSMAQSENKKLLFQRQLGHKLDIPRSGQWEMLTDPQHHHCWVCDKWIYSLIFWTVQTGYDESVEVDMIVKDKIEEQIMSFNKDKQSNRIKIDQGAEEDEWAEEGNETDRDAEFSEGYGNNEPLTNKNSEIEADVVLSDPRQAMPKVPYIYGSFNNWKKKPFLKIEDFCTAIDQNPPDYLRWMRDRKIFPKELKNVEQLNPQQKQQYDEFVEEQSRPFYRKSFKEIISKNLLYRKPYIHNAACFENFDERTMQQLYVFPIFLKAGKHSYMVENVDRETFLHKFIANFREEEIPIFVKESKIKRIERVFRKDASVFKDWKEDTDSSLARCQEHDAKYWKVPRFVKDPSEIEKCWMLVQQYFKQLKNIFITLASRSSFPNISWIDFTTFCENCKVLDKNVVLATIDRLFIATNVELEQSSDNPDKSLCRYEFFEILARLANAKYKEPGLVATHSEAFKRLLEECILPNASIHPWQEFRDKQIWTIQVNDTLEANLEGLKKVYQLYFEPRKKYMTMQDALSLLMKDSPLGLIEKDAIFCYGMCKMTCVNEMQDSSVHYKQLRFVEFLELICRVADLKFKGTEAEKLNLLQRIELVLDEILQVVEVKRKEVNIKVDDMSESDDDY